MYIYMQAAFPEGPPIWTKSLTQPLKNRNK